VQAKNNPLEKDLPGKDLPGNNPLENILPGNNPLEKDLPGKKELLKLKVYKRIKKNIIKKVVQCIN
jgi:hypothetical protein